MELGPLPSRHHYTPEQVAHHQRERLIAALATCVAERGYAALTVGEVAAAAHVSRRAFYEHFATKEACFLAAFDAIAAHVRTLTRAAASRHPDDWAAGLIAGLRAALAFFAREPDLARLVFLESPAAGPALQRRYGEIFAVYAPYMSRGRSLVAGPGSTRSERVRGSGGGEGRGMEGEGALIGGLAFKIARQVSAHGPESLPAQLPAFAEYLLTPYLGPASVRTLALRCSLVPNNATKEQRKERER